MKHMLFYGDRANCDHHPDPQEILKYITIVLKELGNSPAFDYIIAKEHGGKNGQAHWQIVVEADHNDIKPNELRNAKLKFKWKSSSQNSSSMFTVKRQMSEDDPQWDEKMSYPLKEYAMDYSDTAPYFANENIITSFSASQINDLMYLQREDFLPHYEKKIKLNKLSPYQLFNEAFEAYLDKTPFTHFHNNGNYAFNGCFGIEYITNFILEYYHIQRVFFDYSKFTRQMNCVLNTYDRTALSHNLATRFLKDNKYLWIADNPLDLSSLPDL